MKSPSGDALTTRATGPLVAALRATNPFPLEEHA